MAYGWHNDAMGSGWWVLMVVGMLAFLAVFVIGGVLLVRHYSQLPSDPGASNSAIDILKQRFARGAVSYTHLTLPTNREV